MQLLKNLRFSNFFAFVGVLLLALLLILPALATADDIDEDHPFFIDSAEALRNMEQQRLNWRDQQVILERQIIDSLAYAGELQRQIAVLDAEQTVIAGEIFVMEQTIANLQALIVDAVLAIEQATIRMEGRQEHLRNRVREIDMHGGITLLDVLFHAATIDEFLVMYHDVERIVIADRNLINEIISYRETIKAERQRLEDALEAQEYVLAQLEEQHAELERVQNIKTAAMRAAEQNAINAANKQAELEAASRLAEQAITEFMARNPVIARDFGGSMAWPLPANFPPSTISSPFGMRHHPILGGQRMHTGIDVPAPTGTRLYAAATGEIIFRGWLGGYGNTVIIHHGLDQDGNGVSTLYAHLSAFSSFAVGDFVISSDVIGFVGSTGQSTGPHLHFEVRINNAPTDPCPFVGC